MYILYMYVFESLYICTYHVHVHTVQSLKINIVKTSQYIKLGGDRWNSTTLPSSLSSIYSILKPKAGSAKLQFWIFRTLIERNTTNDHHFEVKLNIKDFVFHAFMACHRQKIRWGFFLVNTSNRIRCINWRTQLHAYDFRFHARY